MLAEGLLALLAADPGTSGILGSPAARADKTTGIFPGTMPEGTPMPALEYSDVHAENEMTHDGPDPFTMQRIQLSCHGASYGDAKHLARAVRQALESYTGPLGDVDMCEVDSMHRISELDAFEYGPFDYMAALDFEIAYRDRATGISNYLPEFAGGDSLPTFDTGMQPMPAAPTTVTARTTKVLKIILVNLTNQNQPIVLLTDGNGRAYLEANFPLAPGETLPIDLGAASFTGGIVVQAQNANAVNYQIVGWQ
jgi:hypothetical protein